MKTKKKRNWLWWWVTGAFVVLITCWTTLILIAVNNIPEQVPLVEHGGQGDG